MQPLLTAECDTGTGYSGRSMSQCQEDIMQSLLGVLKPGRNGPAYTST